jgi:hypothetical protein
VELFLRSRGNLSSVGEELDTSYPTVTRRLDAVLAALRINGAAGHGRANGLATEQHEPPVQPAPPDESERLQILEMLDRGEITAEEATRRLKEL